MIHRPRVNEIRNQNIFSKNLAVVSQMTQTNIDLMLEFLKNKDTRQVEGFMNDYDIYLQMKQILGSEEGCLIND